MKKCHHSTRALRWYLNRTHFVIIRLQKETCSRPNPLYKLKEELELGGDLRLPQSVKRCIWFFRIHCQPWRTTDKILTHTDEL